jgi:hypothetical protein
MLLLVALGAVAVAARVAREFLVQLPELAE